MRDNLRDAVSRLSFLRRFHSLLYGETHYGREIRDIPHPLNSEIDLTQLRCADQVNLDRAVHSIGSTLLR